MNIVFFKKRMAQINKRTELTKLVNQYKTNEVINEYPELSEDTPQNAGKIFELFLCKEIYGPILGISSDEELDASMDFNSSGEGPIDIAFLPGDNDLHIFEAKWLSKASASFNKDWTSKVLKVEDLITNKDSIQELPDYAREKLNDFLDHPSKDKTLNVYLSTNTAPNDDQTKDFEDRTLKSSERFKDFNLVYHLHRATVIYDEWSRVHSTTLQDQEIKKNDLYNHENRTFPVADQHKEIIMIVASGNEIVDWVKKNKNIFHENIRGYRGKNKVNKELLETMDLNPEEFITFNNGITAATTSIHDNGDSYTFENFQIINGCQTASTLRDYSETKYKDVSVDEKIENLRNLRVLVRVVKVDSTASDTGTKAKLIKANNTQTPIKSSDFRSTDPVQVSIEAFINSNRNIKYNKERVSYERKVRYLKKKKNHRYIKLTELAEHVYAFEQDPYTIYRNTNNLYDDQISKNSIGNYWKIFGNNGIDTDRLPDRRIEELFGIVFLSIYITDEIKKRTKGEDAESLKSTLYYLKRFYTSMIGHSLRSFMDSDDYEHILKKCFKGSAFENENIINAIHKLIDEAFIATKIIYRAVEMADEGSKVNMKNFGRRKGRFDTILNEFLQNEGVREAIDNIKS